MSLSNLRYALFGVILLWFFQGLRDDFDIWFSFRIGLCYHGMLLTH